MTDSTPTIDVVVGQIGKPHGLTGAVTVQIRTDEPERRFAPGAHVWVQDRVLTVHTATPGAPGWVVSFTEITDRTQAEQVRQAILITKVDPQALPDDPDEFYDHQLRECQVYVGHRLIGEVAEVVHLPAQDLLAIRRVAPPHEEVLVPFVKAIAPVVDVSAKRIELTPPPGLIDEVSEAEQPDAN